jgi:hypothetical protein
MRDLEVVKTKKSLMEKIIAIEELVKILKFFL